MSMLLGYVKAVVLVCQIKNIKNIQIYVPIVYSVRYSWEIVHVPVLRTI